MHFFDQNWSSISFFYSATSTENYLDTCYQQQFFSNSKALSLQNSKSFIYYLEYAQSYYKQSLSSPFVIQPILLFYGYIQLLKACLLVVDPHYPQTTALLAHGVTTRKKKKQHYSFWNDDLKVQKNGLYSYVSEKIFKLKQIEGEKVMMKDLLSQIPELDEVLQFFDKPYSFTLSHISEHQYETSNKILDTTHMSADRLQTYLQQSFQQTVSIKEDKNHLLFERNKPFLYNYTQPFRYNLHKDQFHLCPIKETNCGALGEILIHYLLLYNLSMIARYETPWWLELTKNMPNEDFPLIQKFLQVASEKGPFLISKWLLEEHTLLFI